MSGALKFLPFLICLFLFGAVCIFAADPEETKAELLAEFFSAVRKYTDDLGDGVSLDLVLRKEVGNGKSIEEYSRALVRKVRARFADDFRRSEYLALDIMANTALAEKFKDEFSRGFYEWYFDSVPTYLQEVEDNFHFDKFDKDAPKGISMSNHGLARQGRFMSLAARSNGDLFIALAMKASRNHTRVVAQQYLKDPSVFKSLADTAGPAARLKLGEYEPEFGILSDLPEAFVGAVPEFVSRRRRSINRPELEHDFFGKKIAAFAARAEKHPEAFSDASLKSLIEIGEKYAEPNPQNERNRELFEHIRERRFEAEFDRLPPEHQLAFIQKVRATTSDGFAQSLWGRAFESVPAHETYRTVVHFLRERGDLNSDEKAVSAYDDLFEHLDKKIIPALNPPPVENDPRIPYLRDGYLLKVAEDLVMDTSPKTDLSLLEDLSVDDVERVLTLFGRDRVPTGFSRLESLPLRWLRERSDKRFTKKDLAELEKYRKTLVHSPRIYEGGQTLISDRVRMDAIRERRRVPLHRRVLWPLAKPKERVELPPTLPADCMFEALFAPNSSAKAKVAQ